MSFEVFMYQKVGSKMSKLLIFSTKYYLQESSLVLTSPLPQLGSSPHP